jgi:hypothetical protein
MIVQHPLLVKININNCNNIHEAYTRILDLGLNAKIHNTTIIVKYPKTKKYIDADYILQSRGIIIDFTNKSVINSSLHGCLNIEQFYDKILNWNSIVIEECLDGTLINLYYHDKWKLSTKFSIDTEESKFKSHKTFKELFNEINSIDFDILDKSYTYSFLLQHTEIRNVSLVNVNKLYHLESTNNITGEKVEITIPNIEKPKLLKYRDIINILNVNNLSELIIKTNNLPWTNPGYILYSEDRKYRSKIENPNFIKVLNLVKDQSNLKFLILESLYKKCNIKDLLKYYPEYSTKAVEVNTDFNNYAIKLHKLYIKCKVNNVFVDLEKNFKKTICDVHNLFKDERKKNNQSFKITYNHVCNILRNYDTAYLYSIIYPK